MSPRPNRPKLRSLASCVPACALLLAGVTRAAAAVPPPGDKAAVAANPTAHSAASPATAANGQVTGSKNPPPAQTKPQASAQPKLLAAAVSPDAPQALRVAIPPGPQKDTLRRVLLKPYAAATGTELGDVAWDGTQDGLAKIATDQVADIVLVDGNILAAGCAAQSFRRLDWNRLGRARFLPGASSDCGAGAFVTAIVLAWDREKLQGDQKPSATATTNDHRPNGSAGAPPSQPPGQGQKDTAAEAKPAPDPQWSDFWDVAKHPGRRGLQHQAQGNLEFALLADGVAPGDIYRTLRTGDGVDRAFRKLDQLKPYIMWWDQPGQPAQFLSSGKVLFTSAPSSSLSAMNPPAGHARPGVQWAGSLTAVQSWVSLSSANANAALAAMLIATDPAREAELARATGLGPSTSDAVALLPDDLRAASPVAAANLKLELPLDEGFWRDNGKTLEARFSDWVSK